MTRLTSWPPPIESLWLALSCAALISLVASSPILPHDAWWSVVQGRAIEQLGAIPQQNLYLYTLPADAPFYNQPWLSQLLMWRLYKLAGNAGLAYASLALFIATLAITLRHALAALPRARIISAAALILYLPDLDRWMPRTQMFAAPLFAAFLYALLRYLDGHLSRRALLTLLAPLMLLWANLHGSFFLALLLLTAAAAGQALHAFAAGSLASDARALAARWAPPAALCLLVPMLNPRGPAIYQYILSLSLSSHVSQITAEWRPLSASPDDLPLLLLVAIPALLTLALWRAAGWSRVFMIWGFAILSLRSARTLFWWPLLLIPLLPPLLLHLRNALLTRLNRPIPAHQPPHPGSPIISAAALVTIATPIALCLPGLPLLPAQTVDELSAKNEVYHPQDRLLSHGHPTDVAAKLARRGFPGYIFHDASIGGYLELILTPDTPRQVAFVDQRIELIPVPIWLIHTHLSEARLDHNAEFDKRYIETALLNVRRQRPLQEALEADPAWRRVAVDYNFVLYMRADRVPDAWRDDPTRDLPITPPSALDAPLLTAGVPPLRDTQHGLPDRPPSPR